MGAFARKEAAAFSRNLLYSGGNAVGRDGGYKQLQFYDAKASDYKTELVFCQTVHALAYIMKYIEKSGEKIVYSRGLAQFFISDVMDEDIVCLYGMEEQKFLLYDDFGCWNEGEYIGQVSRETIAKMPKAN